MSLSRARRSASSNRAIRIPANRSPIQRARIAQPQIVVIGRFRLAYAIRQPLQNAIMIQHDLSIQSPSQIDLHNVASQQRRLFQRLQRVLRHILVRRAMAQQLHRPGCSAAA